MAAVAALMPALTRSARSGPIDREFRHGHGHVRRDGRKKLRRRAGPRGSLVDPADADGRADGWAARRGRGLAARTAAESNLGLSVSYADVFAHCDNAPEAVALLARALDAEGMPHDQRGPPMLASEDFGVFGRSAPSAMFLLGAGEDCPGLHNPDYDFPEALIVIGARVSMRTLREICG